jgi:hypothetical protein
MYKCENIQNILDRPDDPVQEKLNLLLRYLGKLSEFPGECTEFDSNHDYSVLGAKNSQEADFYLQSLAEQGLVTLESAIYGLYQRLDGTGENLAGRWKILKCFHRNVVRS